MKGLKPYIHLYCGFAITIEKKSYTTIRILY